MSRGHVAQRVRRTAVLGAVLALGVLVTDVASGKAPTPSASFVPDDNRGFQFDVTAGPEDGTTSGATDALEVICGFYDQGAAREKRVIVYRETGSGTLLGLAVHTRWVIAAECVVPGDSDSGGAAATASAAIPRVVMRPPITVPLTYGRRRRSMVLVVAWVRRPNGHWAQLERYSVLRQRGGTMYQFGDFRVECCLDGASAYVQRRRVTAMSSTTTVPGTTRRE